MTGHTFHRRKLMETHSLMAKKALPSSPAFSSSLQLLRHNSTRVRPGRIRTVVSLCTLAQTVLGKLRGLKKIVRNWTEERLELKKHTRVSKSPPKIVLV